MAEVTIHVSQDGSRLVLEDNSTLYYFAPQRVNPAHDLRVIPWMANWPDYLQFWMHDWSPLTIQGKNVPVFFDPADVKPYRLSDEKDLKPDERFLRQGGPKKNEYQILFRGWSLYTYKGDDHPNQISGLVNGLWHVATPNLVYIQHYLTEDTPTPPEQSYGSGP